MGSCSPREGVRSPSPGPPRWSSPSVDLARDSRAFHDRQPDVDGVAEEYPREALRDHAGRCPAALRAMGACSREEPQPKFSPATMMLAGLDAAAAKPGLTSSMQCAASTSGSVVFRYRAGMISSVFTSLPKTYAVPLEAAHPSFRPLPPGSPRLPRGRHPACNRARRRRGRGGEVDLARAVPHAARRSCGSSWTRTARLRRGCPCARPGRGRRSAGRSPRRHPGRRRRALRERLAIDAAAWRG